MNGFDQGKVSPTPIKQVVRILQSSGYDNFSLPKCDWGKKKKKKGHKHFHKRNSMQQIQSNGRGGKVNLQKTRDMCGHIG